VVVSRRALNPVVDFYNAPLGFLFARFAVFFLALGRWKRQLQKRALTLALTLFTSTDFFYDPGIEHSVIPSFLNNSTFNTYQRVFRFR
jgi:hypothetical protein